jgi:DNA invertase Pin-like site-specific DNA recombinase
MSDSRTAKQKRDEEGSEFIQNVLQITDRKAGFRSLGDAWANTTTPHGRLMVTMLAGLSEFERELIRTRTSEGRARAVARSVKMGRKPKLTPHAVRVKRGEVACVGYQ